jgi:photosystem II stability/assembly factor-like uncharacterized protein
MRRSYSATPARAIALLSSLLLLLNPSSASAQRHKTRAAASTGATASTSREPTFKGLWESVSYPADIEFTDVYFVTPDIGWATGFSRTAAGEGGVILHTKDGGASWQVQLGDPESATRGFRAMQFIDATHGWVAQYGGKLLRTTDGASWETVGDWSYGQPYRFISSKVGFGLHGKTIERTTDGGGSWQPVFECQAKIQVNGLTQSTECNLEALHFPSPRVGYAVTADLPNKASAIVKTEDGGSTWRVMSFIPDVSAHDGAIHFMDETNGIVRTYSKIFLTSDGGQTWRGAPATVPGGSPAIRFADPEVGWIIEGQLFTYTTDGGKSWNSRETAFPARVSAFSLPRRDRGYVVGDHGMVFRYRLVPSDEQVAGKSLPGPAMPSFDTPLDDQVTELAGAVEQLQTNVAAAPDSVSGPVASASPSTPSPTDSSATQSAGDVTTSGAATANPGTTEPPSTFTARCCGRPLGTVQLILAAVSGALPQFLASHKNSNLLLAGLRMMTDLPARLTDLNGALHAFSKAANKAAALEALARVSAAAKALDQSTAVAFQKQVPLPAMDTTTEAVAPSPVPPGETAVQAQPAPAPSAVPPAAAQPATAAASPTGSGVATEVTHVVEEGAKQKAQKGLGKAIKKKFHF